MLIARQLEVLGETPEAMRDLVIVLYQLTSLHYEQQAWQRCRQYGVEGLSISQRLAHLLPTLPDYATLPDDFTEILQQLSKIDDQEKEE